MISVKCPASNPKRIAVKIIELLEMVKLRAEWHGMDAVRRLIVCDYSMVIIAANSIQLPR
jgi:hypothetical protein